MPGRDRRQVSNDFIFQVTGVVLKSGTVLEVDVVIAGIGNLIIPLQSACKYIIN